MKKKKKKLRLRKSLVPGHKAAEWWGWFQAQGPSHSSAQDRFKEQLHKAAYSLPPSSQAVTLWLLA